MFRLETGMEMVTGMLDEGVMEGSCCEQLYIALIEERSPDADAQCPVPSAQCPIHTSPVAPQTPILHRPASPSKLDLSTSSPLVRHRQLFAGIHLRDPH